MSETKELTEDQEKAIAKKELKRIAQDMQNLADAIVRVSELGKLITEGPLAMNTVALLIKQRTNIPQYEILKVLNTLPELKSFLK